MINTDIFRWCRIGSKIYSILYTTIILNLKFFNFVGFLIMAVKSFKKSTTE